MREGREGCVIDAACVKNLFTLKKDYENVKQIKLDTKPSKLGWPIFLGGVDVLNKNLQIDFITQMHLVLTTDLHLPEDAIPADSTLPREELLALRTLIAVLMYINSQLNDNSKLKGLLNKKFGINHNNKLTPDDQTLCLMAASSFMCMSDPCGEINKKLHRLGKPGIHEMEWRRFQQYVQGEMLKCKILPPSNLFPCATLGSYLFGHLGAYAGGSLGVICGSLVSEQFLSSKTYLSTVFGTMAVLINVSPVWAVLVAPIAVNAFLKNFLEISLGHIVAMAGQILGQGIGACLGFPGDVIIYLLKEIAKTIGHLIHGTHACVSGYQLTNGVYVANGVEVRMHSQLDKSCDQKIPDMHISINDSGFPSVTIDGKFIELDYPVHVKDQLQRSKEKPEIDPEPYAYSAS